MLTILYIFICKGANSGINKLYVEIVADLKMMLDEHNVLVKSFRMVRDTIRQNVSPNIKLRLIGRREQNEMRYNLPTVYEVTSLILSGFETSAANRDIIVKTQNGDLQ